MLNFEFLEKGLGIVSPPHLCMIFQEKCFSCYITGTPANTGAMLKTNNLVSVIKKTL